MNGYNGTVTIDDGGTPDDPTDDTIIYTPDDGFEGVDEFTYTVTDPEGNPITANVTVQVDPETPFAAPDLTETNPSQPVAVDVLINDSDPNNDPLTIVPDGISDPPRGTATLDDNGTPDDPSDDTVVYTPDDGFVGTDSFTYTITDPDGNIDTAVVNIVVGGTPIAEDDRVTTPIDVPVNVDVLVNDTDPDGDPLTIEEIITPPTDGTVTIEDNGTPDDPNDDFLVYTPNTGFSGTDSLEYQINDGNGGTDTAIVTIRVVEPSPIVDDFTSTPPGQPIVIDVSENDDQDDGGPFTITEVSDPPNGTVTIDDGGTPDDPTDDTIIYTPDDGFEGVDEFTYTVTDPEGNPITANVTVQVDPETPFAAPDLTETNPSQPVAVDVLINDSDPNNDPLTIVPDGISDPPRGTATLDDNGTPDDPSDDTVVYTPDDGFVGTDSFTYTITDPDGNIDTAVVNIVVGGTPIAEDDRVTTPIDVPVNVDVLVNDTDPDGDPLTIEEIVTPPTDGTVTIEDNGTPDDPNDDFLVYTPNTGFSGTDSLEYQINDGNGGTDTAIVTIRVVEPSPIVDDFTSTPPGQPIVIDVSENDDQDDGGPFTITEVSDPPNGTVTIDDGGTPDDPTDDTIIYTPDDGFEGVDEFTYTVTDPEGNPITANVTVQVDPETPFAAPDLTETNPSQPVAIDVLINDSDPNNDPLTIVPDGISDPPRGTATLDDNGTPDDPSDDTVVYTPDDGFVGTDSFTYTITDPDGNIDTAVVNIVVGGTPVAEDDFVEGSQNIFQFINPLLNDIGPEGSTLTIIDFNADDTEGQVQRDGVGFRYTPPIDFVGLDTFTYTISDGRGGTDTATVTINVNPAESLPPGNNSPTANDNQATTITDQVITIDVLANDTDPDGDSLSISEFDSSSENGGTISQENDQLIYTPPEGFTGTDTFTYTISDGNDGFDTATVTVTVNAAIDPIPQDCPDCEDAPTPEAITITPVIIDPTEVLPERPTSDTNTITGTEGDDSLEGTENPDQIDALGGNDVLNGIEGNDSLLSGSGDDSGLGSEGDDLLFGDPGDDTLNGGQGNDVISAGTGDDIALAELGNDTLAGEDGDDILLGGTSNAPDVPRDTEGQDLLFGGDGDDSGVKPRYV